MTHREEGWTPVAGGPQFIGSDLCKWLLDAGERVLCVPAAAE